MCANREMDKDTKITAAMKVVQPVFKDWIGEAAGYKCVVVGGQCQGYSCESERTGQYRLNS